MDPPVSEIAATIGVPARARMLYSLLDDRARTSTELATVAGVTPSTASVHLGRLVKQRLVKVFPQGRHRYYRLGGRDVAAALEALSVLTAGSIDRAVADTPDRLRLARTCYDHVAGRLGVELLAALERRGWLEGPDDDRSYRLTADGRRGLEALGIDVEALLRARRRFAFACIDWSERRPHLAGAVGAALLDLLQSAGWVRKALDSRCLEVTAKGRRELPERLGLTIF